MDDVKGKTTDSTVIVSDAEEEIPQNIAHSDLQLDLEHATVRNRVFRMWMDGASRK